MLEIGLLVAQEHFILKMDQEHKYISQCISPSWFVLAASSSGFTQVFIYAQQFIQEECTNSFIVSLYYELPLNVAL